MIKKIQKCNIGIKNAEFDDDLDSIDKVAKTSHTKKVINEKVKNRVFDFYYCAKVFGL
jgi:hypothetical protein